MIDILNIWNTVWPILVAIVIFGVIVFIHEFGHFIFAKLFKIRVNEFAIGFGPAIIKFTHGETLYALRILPFGGYCAMEGENEDSTDERAFCKAKIWKRIIVVAAGAVFNIILGFLLMVCIVAPQQTLATTTVAEFDSAAVSNADGGIMVDDKILKISGRTIYSPDDISYMLSNSRDGFVTMTVERDGKKIELPRVKFQQKTAKERNYLVLDFKVYAQKNGFFTCISQSFARTVSMGRLVWMSLGDLITGQFGINDISGPVGVTQIVSEAVTQVRVDGVAALSYLMRILCLITINLGIFNLLPIPAFDGSRIWFLAVEGIRRKPIKNEAVVHAVGLFIMLGLMIFLVFKDLWSWIF